MFKFGAGGASMPANVNSVLPAFHVVLQSASHRPDANISRARFSEDARAGTGGGAGGENVIDQHDVLATEPAGSLKRKSVPDVGGALMAAEKGLGAGVFRPAQEAGWDMKAGCPSEVAGQTFGLVEFPFAFLHGVQGHGNDLLPMTAGQFRKGLPDQEVGEKILEPKRAVVFVAMDNFKHDAIRHDGGTCGPEVEVHFIAIAAFKLCGDLAVKGQTAPLAKRRLDESDAAIASPAGRANVTFGCRGPLLVANLTHRRVEKAQPRIKPAFHRLDQGGPSRLCPRHHWFRVSCSGLDPLPIP
jgi:hypothetical protein